MEWETQPEPFRRFDGAPRTRLPFLETDPGEPADALFRGSEHAAPVTLPSIAGLLELSLGLSCWKEVSGSRWALRMNPSSGNLHPTEAYLVLPATNNVAAGVYHYLPRDHGLEQRLALSQVNAGNGFFLGLTAIFWRESWKYGERAFRYCNHDAGHALAALRFSANLFGWQTRVCPVADSTISALLGLNRTDWIEQEAEHPDMLLWIGPGDPVITPPDQLIDEASRVDLQGAPNRLSPGHRHWEIIDAVAQATERSGALTTPTWYESAPRQTIATDLRGASIIRRRRSAVDMDPEKSTLSQTQFQLLIDLLLPRENTAPFDAMLGESRVHPLFFVHNIEGVDPGLYILVRNAAHREALQSAMSADFLWSRTAPTGPLFLLQPGNLRDTAAQLSCGQEICGNGALAVAMLGRFHDEITVDPGRYRELFWEAGMIGQVIYLAAELFGQRGTGIGCYFDDPVHRLLGLRNNAWQSIYHFTVGFPIEDPRIVNKTPYFHLDRQK